MTQSSKTQKAPNRLQQPEIIKCKTKEEVNRHVFGKSARHDSAIWATNDISARHSSAKRAVFYLWNDEEAPNYTTNQRMSWREEKRCARQYCLRNHPHQGISHSSGPLRPYLSYRTSGITAQYSIVCTLQLRSHWVLISNKLI